MIILKTLKWSNCFSYGSDNSLDLEKDLIVQLVGTNGTGKSSIPLLIEEALFNKNSKGIKKVDIVNRNSDAGGYSISLDFLVDDLNYNISVERKGSIKVVLTCDGEDISSHTATNTFKTVQNVIGMDFKTFSQLVYQSTTSSLQFLTATDTNRKKFLIELLNLDKYLTLFDNFKVAHKEASNEVAEIRGSMETIQSWVDTNPIQSTTKKVLLELPDAPEGLISERALVTSKLENILDINNKININNQYKSQLSELSATELTNEVEMPEGIGELNEEFTSLRTIIDQANTVIRKIEKLGDSCPTCLQEIDSDKTEELLSEQKSVVSVSSKRKNEVQNLVINLKKQLQVYKNHQSEIEKFREAI